MKRNLKRVKRYLGTAGFTLILVIFSLVAYFVPTRIWSASLSIAELEEGEARIHFLSVGQGDCTIVEFYGGEVFVIDAGTGEFEQENRLVRYIKGLHAARIQMILTHANADHYGGFYELLRNFEVYRFYLPVISSKDETYLRLLEAIEKEGCEERTLTRNASIDCIGGYFVCLSPDSFAEKDENDSSTVLYLNCGGTDALFCGDIGASRERRLAKEYALNPAQFDVGEMTVDLEGIDILKVSHHGSNDASSAEWLNLLSPKECFISCGKGNPYGFPRQETLDRLRSASPEGEIYRLDELGDMTVTIKEGKYRIAAREEL